MPATITSIAGPIVGPIVERRRNLCPNPSAEVDASGWTASASAVTRSTEWSSQGAASLRVVGGSASSDIRLAGSGMNSFPPGIVPGRTYTITGTINKVAADTGNTVRARRPIVLYSVTGTSWIELTASFPQAANEPGVQDLRATFDLPANATGCLIGFGFGTTTASQVTYLDAVCISETPGPYFDGSTPASSPLSYAWLGAPGKSASVELEQTYLTTGTVAPELVLGLSEQYESRSSVHSILDRPDPDVTLRETSARSGTLRLFFLTEAESDAAVALHRQATTFTLAYPERPTFACRYVVDGRIRRTLDDETRNRFVVEVDFREVAP